MKLFSLLFVLILLGSTAQAGKCIKLFANHNETSSQESISPELYELFHKSVVQLNQLHFVLNRLPPKRIFFSEKMTLKQAQTQYIKLLQKIEIKLHQFVRQQDEHFIIGVFTTNSLYTKVNRNKLLMIAEQRGFDRLIHFLLQRSTAPDLATN